MLVVNYNGGADLGDCLAALERQTRAAREMVVVDNGSTDGSAERATLRLGRNAGFGGAANAGFAVTSGDPVVVVNPDVVLQEGWLERVGETFAADDRLGVAGGKLLYPDGATIQHAGGIVRWPLMLADHRRYRQPDNDEEREPIDVDYVTGAAIAIRRRTWEQIGGFDEGFFLYFEETDLCQRARHAGWSVRYLPQAVGIHRESAVTGRESAAYYRHYHRGRLRFALKHQAPAAFLVDFVPAERARLGSVVSGDELLGLRAAYIEQACQLEGGDALLAAGQPELRPALADALAALAERAVTTEPTGMTGGRPVATVQARPFASRLPGVAAMRTAWNWMSTRWYVEPIVEQQNAINHEIVEALGRIEARLALQARLIGEIDRDLVALARRMAAPSK